MRHRAVEEFSEWAGDTIAWSNRALRAGSLWLILTALILVFSAPEALANPEAYLVARAGGPENSTPPASLDPASTKGTFEAAYSDPSPDPHPSNPRLSASDQEMSPSREQRPRLSALLAIRSSGRGSSTDKTTDEVLADAIALGPRPELEPKNPFRKRKLDLFRTVHPVSIGNADLVVRFRVRGNMREMMSLDVRF